MAGERAVGASGIVTEDDDRVYGKAPIDFVENCRLPGADTGGAVDDRLGTEDVAAGVAAEPLLVLRLKNRLFCVVGSSTTPSPPWIDMAEVELGGLVDRLPKNPRRFTRGLFSARVASSMAEVCAVRMEWVEAMSEGADLL